MPGKLYLGSLDHIDAKVLVSVLNEAFSDYVVPVHMTQADLESRLFACGYDPSLSVGYFDNGKLVGFIMHGSRAESGRHFLYNIATGVIPSHRGTAFVSRAYDYLLTAVEKDRFDSCSLEVITTNEPAIKAYEKAGFRKSHVLVCLKGSSPWTETDRVRIRQQDRPDWDKYTTLWDWQPSWQNDHISVERAKEDHQFWEAVEGEEFLGYAITNRHSGRLVQFAVSRVNRSQGVMRTLLHHIQKTVSGDVVTLNVDEHATDTLEAMECLGLKPYLEQYQMVRSFV